MLKWCSRMLIAIAFVVVAPTAMAVCLNSCRSNYCVGSCQCQGSPSAECNCNIFHCNCDCCKPYFCAGGAGTCYCSDSAARTKTAARGDAVCVTNCGAPCCDDSTGAMKTVAPKPEEVFREVDANRSGGIDIEEMIAWLAKDADGRVILRVFTRKELRERYFDTVDRNRNGIITAPEFDSELRPKPKSRSKR